MTMLTPSCAEIAAYLARIVCAPPDAPTPEALHRLHLAHASHIPFENLDILLGRPIRLDLASLWGKLVTARRGGYCFEQNLLFAAVLRTFGFDVTMLAARVRYRTEAVLPRTHMLLLVDLDDVRWIADVGFGAEGLLLPVPLVIDRPVTQYLWRYRVTESDGIRTLQSWRAGRWWDLYAFTLEPQLAVDYEVANHYVSTHPASRFVTTLTAQSVTPERRVTLRNHELVVDTGETQSSRQLATDEELLRVLDDEFGLAFPAGTQFGIARTP
ncbi:MAG: arylamine N-acetyltransferase [Betaproteobacteria bacterium]|nr:arylamine N-acetyltransferase [Betaproteobacteria bacterium]